MKAGMSTVHAVCQSSVIAITDWYAGVKLCVNFFYCGPLGNQRAELYCDSDPPKWITALALTLRIYQRESAFSKVPHRYGSE